MTTRPPPASAPPKALNIEQGQKCPQSRACFAWFVASSKRDCLAHGFQSAIRPGLDTCRAQKRKSIANTPGSRLAEVPCAYRSTIRLSRRTFAMGHASTDGTACSIMRSISRILALNADSSQKDQGRATSCGAAHRAIERCSEAQSANRRCGAVSPKASASPTKGSCCVASWRDGMEGPPAPSCGARPPVLGAGICHAPALRR